MGINRNFSTIYGNVGANIQDTSTATSSIIKTYCNNAYKDILRRLNYSGLNLSYQLSAVSGTQDYVLPNDFGKELYVRNASTLQYIPFISLSELVGIYPESLNSSGEVQRYTVFRDVSRNQPSAASIITVVSSSSADTSQVIHIKGSDANGIELSEDVTLTGTSSAVSTNTFNKIRSISKSTTTTGTVTVTSNSGAVTIALLGPSDTSYSVNKIRFHYIPSSAATMDVPYYVKPYNLVSDYDFPVIDCADGIELGATAQAWRYKRQFAKAQEYDRLFEKWIIDEAWDMENHPNRTHLSNPKPYDRDDI